MPTYLGRPIFPLVLNLAPQETRLLYDDGAVESGLGAPAVLAAQTYARRRITLTADNLDATAVHDVETWLATVAITARSAWVPCDLGEATILSVGDTGPRSLRIAGQGWATSFALQAGTVLRFFSPLDAQGYQATVESVATAGQDEILTFADDLPAGLDAKWPVSRLLLARLLEPSWSHESEGLSAFSIAALELPFDYADPAASDTATVTHPVWLYTITRQLNPTDTVLWRLTSSPVPITHDGEVYAPAPAIDHSSLGTSTEGDSDKLTLSLGLWADNPFNAWFPRHSSGRYGVRLDYAEINPATSVTTGTAKRMFRGIVEDVIRKGPLMTINARSALALSTAKVPRFLIQSRCNYAVYDPNTCRLSRDAWLIAGTIAALDAAAATVDFDSAALAARPGDWLVGGTISTGPADAPEVRFVRAAVALTATQHRLTLSQPLVAAVVGAAAVGLPGCDKSISQCHSRFNNRLNFGGHHAVPINNPSIVAVPYAGGGGGGGKK